MMANNRHERIYRYIVMYKSKYDGNSPSIREISMACDISSTSMVKYYLAQLMDSGLISMSEGTGRPKIMVRGGVWRVER